MNKSKTWLLPLTLSSVFAMQPVLANDSKVEDMAEDGAQATEHAYEDAKHESKDAWQDMKEGTKETWKDVKQGSKHAWRDSKAAFNEGVIAGKLETALVLNKHLNPFEIDFEVEGDKVVLSGEVDSNVDKELAGQIAEGIEGIRNVDNRITVDERNSQKELRATEDGKRDFSQYVEDISTTASIKTELLANDEVKGLDINVDTFRDQVTLSGEVDSEAQKSMAEAIAKKRDDVTKVINKLKVTS